MNAPFIVFEGIDGSGKTTQAGRLANRLIRGGCSTCYTSEPYGVIGSAIRKVLSIGPEVMPTDDAMALMFAAARADHLARVIAPSLRSGVPVVCDRFALSSFAYQGKGRDDREEWIGFLTWRCPESYVTTPSLTVLIDVPLKTAAERRDASGKTVDRYEDDGFLARVAENYRRLAPQFPHVRVIDGTGSADEVEAAVLDVVRRELAWTKDLHPAFARVIGL